MENKVFTNILELKGKSIHLLTPPSYKDLSNVQNLFSNISNLTFTPHLIKINGWTKEDAQNRLDLQIKQQIMGKQLNFHIYYKEDLTMKFVGICGFREIIENCGEKYGELGIIVDSAYWRKGLATEAIYLVLEFSFEKDKFNVIEAKTHSENIKTKKFFEKYKFILIRTEFILGSDWDVYQIKRENWAVSKESFLKSIN